MGLNSVQLYTIGHSNVAFADFAALLKQHQIAQVVDIRSAPYSKYCPHFCKSYFEEHLFPEFEISYTFLGHILGGRRPEVRQLTDLSIPIPQDILIAFTDLLRMASETNITLMCGEEQPYTCHRHLILARRLLQPDFLHADNMRLDIRHIRGDGSWEPASPALEKEQLTFSFSAQNA